MIRTQRQPFEAFGGGCGRVGHDLVPLGGGRRTSLRSPPPPCLPGGDPASSRLRRRRWPSRRANKACAPARQPLGYAPVHFHVQCRGFPCSANFPSTNAC
ncbi:hypothetical protein HMPREF3150_03382 [Pseudomonas aeruginosa]|nr:hypothetical protein HMPREF3150_03382 [Pseudomonas aeruginosa]